jgi:LL-diaminopimelate aminotransferase
MGLDVVTPRASLYVWSPIPAGWDCATFVTAALEQAGVSLTPGTVFGPSGEGFVRISITAPLERVQQAMDRLGEWLAIA